MNNKIYEDEKNNGVRLSEFKHFEGVTTFSNVAAKFVVKGSETYEISGKRFHVKAGEYIIGNNDLLSDVIIKENTIGLCIDISNEIISEVVDHVFENPDLSEFILTDRFLVNKYHSQHTHLGHRLNRLSDSLLQGKESSLLSTELFYSIGENIVNDQAIVFEQLSKLNYKKQEVNEEVFRNLLNSKYYIDEHFLNSINLEDLTKVAMISKYAYIRLFKTTFGLSPYQYLLQKKLSHAKQLILNGNKVSDVALLTGFADTAAFSKAFKGFFGITPSAINK